MKLTPQPTHPPSGTGSPRPTGLATRPQAIDSQALLQGGRMVEIAHEGTTYRLQATRQGKLILTK